MTRRLAGALLFLMACGGGGSTDIDATLRFADRTDAEILRLINAAAGSDMFQAEAQINQLGDTFDGDPCPTVTVDGSVATVTGGCTRRDGTRIEGSAVVTNPLGWDQIDFDFGDDTVLEARQLSFTTSGFTQSFDGFIRRSDNFATYDADITVTSFGLTVRSDLYYHCSNPSNPSCTLSGSGVEIPGVGGAQVSGKVKLDADTGRQVSDFTLEGEDTVTVHSSGVCLSWSLEGTTRGTTCP